MFSNIIPCCRRCFNPNENFYVKVTNEYVHYIYISLRYILGLKPIYKQSPVFRPGSSQHLTFPGNAVGLLLRVFDASLLPPESIGLDFIPDATTTCFNVTGQSVETSALVKVLC